MIETPEQLAERRARAIARAKGIEICDGASYRHSTFGPLAQAVAASDAAAGMVLVQGWQDIASAPRDGTQVLAWFDHDAAPYQDPQDPNRITDYAAWADGGEYLRGKGFCIARWFEPHFEAEDEYGTGYWMPAAWFAYENDDYERVCNPLHWMPLLPPPAKDDCNG